MDREIVVIAEVTDGQPTPATLELIAFARALGNEKAGPIRVFVPGREIMTAVTTIAATPGVAVTGIEGNHLASYSGEAWKETLTPLLTKHKPRFVCIPHTANGADFAPGLAVLLGAACITAVETFRIDAGGVVFCRSIHRGKLQTEIAPKAEQTVLTLLPGAFRHDEGWLDASEPAPNGRPGVAVTEIIPAPDTPLKTRFLGLIPAPPDAADLITAEIVIAAGKRIGSVENLTLLRRLASLFSRTAIGASSSVCDAGWLPSRSQIGQTGKTVSPRIYLACGISGALQHVAGMRGSQYIVAINCDPQAAIFRIADVAVVEELVSFLPLLIDACRERQHRTQGGAG